MKKLKYIILAAFLLACIPAAAQKPAQKMTRRQLIKENIRMAKQLDSLRLLLEDYQEQLQAEDSLRTEIIDLYSENEDKEAAGLSSEEYTPEVTDSLLNLWYVHRRSNAIHEGEGFNMDSVHFTSNVPDSVFIRRMEDMHSYITLPYNDKIRNYIILYTEKMPTKMQHMLGLSQYYMPIFEETLSRYNMPQELKYMAIIESALNPTAVSRVGATGMWQFMYNTARSYGLEINSYVDERMDPVKSADAAARYMKDAYKVFGDWNLAISSYNCGLGNVSKAIRRSGSRNFWDLYEYLPRETRGYVPAFVGAMYAFTYYKEHGLSPTPVGLPAHTDTILVRKMLHFQQVSEVVGIPVETLRELNPQYVHDIVPGDGKYVLRIPYNYTAAFVDREDSVYTHRAKEIFTPTLVQNVQESAKPENQRIVYKVKSGDYLGRIAARHHVTVNQIKKWNHLRSNNLRVGQKLIIYRSGHAPAPADRKTSQTKSTQAGTTATGSTYTVKSGDTLYDIAKLYPGVSAKDIMEHNGLKTTAIRPGMKLKIPVR